MNQIEMSILNNLRNRLDINNDSDNYQYYDKEKMSGLNHMQSRLNVRGGTDQWTRMRQDKLRGLKKALLYSYQSAIVQKYDVKRESLANNIIAIITLLQDQKENELSDNQKNILNNLEQQYTFTQSNRSSLEYIRQLEDIVDNLVNGQPLFRCLINHDKLKVAYEDKIISIPFNEPPIGSIDPIDTNFHNGTVFKWVHGNKEEWTPDTYWIVYMQYSQETAYFRAEIRKADQEIEIVIVNPQGQEETVSYRGWMTGPNETSVLWNTKKGVTWNDLNYTKLLYITKDEDTTAFFERFDRVIINGKPWQVQAYNESYSTSKSGGVDSGIIRVALKETYTSTDQFVDQKINEINQNKEKQIQYDEIHTEARIDGPTIVNPYERLIYIAKNFEEDKEWSIDKPELAKIVKISTDRKTIIVDILTGRSNKEGFNINYGDFSLNVRIESF